MSSFFNSALKNLGFKGPSNRGVDTRMRFSIQPFPGDSGFSQWHDAMKMVARLPGGIPPEFRKRLCDNEDAEEYSEQTPSDNHIRMTVQLKLWLTLSDRHIQMRKIEWRTTKQFCFNERSNPDDDKLGTQIVKDLHRTGCSMFSGEDAEHNQALLKRVLLAYARWNKNVGYCQGFNMLAAIILEVMEWREEDALKVMLFLIEGVLPESYFANHLRGLSVDMAVFRDLLGLRLCSLSHHLDRLQFEARDSTTGTSYEPPLTNVFTMQWFLTLFSNCLPKSTVLRVWDLIFLEGNEVLLRTALAIWDGLADRIVTVESADEFYSIMGVLTREMLEFGLMDANDLVTTISTMAPFPFPQLSDLRDKYTYNIRPFTSSLSARRTFKLFYSDDEDDDDEHIVMATWCVSNSLPVSRNRADANSKGPSLSSSSAAIFTAISPGALSPNVGNTLPSPSCSNVNAERMTLDLSALKKQYAKLKERQKQAHIILTGGFQNHSSSRSHPPIAVNHLLLGKKPLTRKNKKAPLTTFALRPMREKENAAYISKQINKNVKQQVQLPRESGETLSWKQIKKQKKKSSNEKKSNEDCLQIETEKDIEKGEINFIDFDKNKKYSGNSSTSSSSTELCDEDATELSDYMSSPEPHRKFTSQSVNPVESDNVIDSKTENVNKFSRDDACRSNTTTTVSIASECRQEKYDWTSTFTEHRQEKYEWTNRSQVSPSSRKTLLEIASHSTDIVSSAEVSPEKVESSSCTISPNSSSGESSNKSLNDDFENNKSSDPDDTGSDSKQEKYDLERITDLSMKTSFRSSFDNDNISQLSDDSNSVMHKEINTTHLLPDNSRKTSKIYKTPIASSFRERKDQISAQSYSPFPTLRKNSVSGSVREVGIKLGIYETTEKRKAIKEGNQTLSANTLMHKLPR